MRNIGFLAETYVANYLSNNNYIIRSRNFAVHNVGEIDIVAELTTEPDDIYFIEVRARKDYKDYPNPAESITKSKQRKLYKMAQIYVDRFGLEERNICFLIAQVSLTEDQVVQSVEIIPF